MKWKPLEIIPKVRKASTRSLKKVVDNIQRRMSEEGKPITYPVKWDSPKQRRYVMWLLRKNDDLPYTRKGIYKNGWKRQDLPNGFKLSNKHPAGAIGGMPNGWQSRIHRGRWNYLPRVLREELAVLPRDVLENLRIEFR